MLKGLKRRQSIYVVKLNPIRKEASTKEPEWLSKYVDIFIEELIDMPPKHEVDHEIEHEVDHEIELVLEAQPIEQTEPIK